MERVVALAFQKRQNLVLRFGRLVAPAADLARQDGGFLLCARRLGPVARLAQPFPDKTDQKPRKDAPEDHEEKRDLDRVGQAKEQCHVVGQKLQADRRAVGEGHHKKHQPEHGKEKVAQRPDHCPLSRRSAGRAAASRS